MAEVILIAQLFQKLKLEDLFKCKDILDSVINRTCVAREEEIKSKSPLDYVEYNEEFIVTDSVEYSALCADVESLKFNKNANHPVSKWLTVTGQEYKWESSNGHVTVKSPDDLAESTAIHKLMQDINSKYDTELNSCLVSYYRSGSAKTTQHDDGEATLDPASPIVVVSLGAPRRVEFVHHGQSHRSKAIHSITPADGSLYMMKPGCQEFFEHRVPVNYKEKNSRFCLSFRRMIPISDGDEASSPKPNEVSNEVKEIVERFTGETLDALPAIKDSPVKNFLAPKDFANPPKKKKTTVLFGTSVTKWVMGKKLATNGRKFINISQSGAKIKHISENVEDFYRTNKAATDVEKVILSFGTNDIKYSRRGVAHLKRYVIDLVTKTKVMFPGAIVLIQCCLPIRNLYWYTVPNVMEFNKILIDICREYNCVYIDCFREFLTGNGSDQNQDLFSDWLHLNGRGLSILSSWFKVITNQSSYNYVLDLGYMG